MVPAEARIGRTLVFLAVAASSRICIVSSGGSPDAGIAAAMRRQAEVLGERHEVTLIENPEPSEAISSFSFASEDHRRSAAVLEAIEAAYGPDRPPHYLEVCDYRAPGLVPLQARAAGHELLRGTVIGVRATATAELLALHDGAPELAGDQRAAELEREQLRLADRLLWPGGDVLARYRRHYADLALPPAVRVGCPLPPPEPAQALPPTPRGGPLRILCLGRLDRRNGVTVLVEACLALPDDEWELTLAGTDTQTAPLGQSMQMTIEMICGGDPRVLIVEPSPDEELHTHFGEHDLLAVPSMFEVCSHLALEAMRAGLPVLTTPVGAHVEAVEPGISGWLCDDVGAAALGRALTPLVAEPDAVARVRSSKRVAEAVRRAADPKVMLDAYDEMLGHEPAPAPSRAATRPSRVTAVVPYYRAHLYVAEAVGSLLGQTHRQLDVVLVDDGSFAPEDGILDELAADRRVRVVHQLNRGDASARNLGIALAEGDYLMMFDADNVLEPQFVARALELLSADPELAYVTCWLRYVDPEGEALNGGGYAPLGNRVLSGEEENWDGDTVALVSRRWLQRLRFPFHPRATIHSDWDLYRRLREAGGYGAVIPEPLARYRIQPHSILRSHDRALHRRSWAEMRSWRRLERAG
jgi:glycosyltransferase involved in cell wall biosynthesis/GT2 family glycosyltransferase